jgi:hypothetical protein
LGADLAGGLQQDQRSYRPPFARVYVRAMISFAPILITLIVVCALMG